ncbi:MAG: hypothetical protein ACREKL_01500 [Chthoniobacterales bacterium]
MKVALLCLSLAAVCLASCTTIQNRRDMYCGYGRVNGPYTSGKYLEKKETVIVASEYKDVVK